MNLIYINYRNSSVLEAQVLSLLEHLKSLGYFNKVILFQGYVSGREKKAIADKLSGFSVEVLWYRTFPNYRLLYLFTFFVLKFSLKKFNKNLLWDKTIFHARGEFMGAIVAKSLMADRSKSGDRLLVDIRGASIPELNIYFKKNRILRNWRTIIIERSLKCLVKNNIRISAVSTSLTNYLVTEFGFKPSVIHLNPNIAGETFGFSLEQRIGIRKALQVKPSEIIVVCSTGGSAAWQKDSVVIDFLLSNGMIVLNLSKTVIDKPGVINKFVPFKEVPAILSAADLAVLWRDDNLVNRVASPSKFSEFCSNGLPVLHNSSVDLAAEYIDKYCYGQNVREMDEFELNDNYYISDMDTRNKMSKIGFNIFSVYTIARSYYKLYNFIIENSDSL